MKRGLYWCDEKRSGEKRSGERRSGEIEE